MPAYSTDTRRLIAAADAAKRAERKARPRLVKHKRAEPTAAGQRDPRKVMKAHKGFVAGLFCIATKIRTGEEVYGVQVAHQRFSDAASGVVNPGKGVKSHDWRTLPLTPAEHHRQHARGNEIAYWEELGLTTEEVTALGRALHAATGAQDYCEDLLRHYADIARRRARLPVDPTHEK